MSQNVPMTTVLLAALLLACLLLPAPATAATTPAKPAAAATGPVGKTTGPGETISGEPHSEGHDSSEPVVTTQALHDRSAPEHAAGAQTAPGAVSPSAGRPAGTRAPDPWYFSAHPFGLLTMPELVKRPRPGKKLFWKLSTGYQYDTNCILNAIGVPIPATVAKMNDARAMVNLVGTWYPHKTPQKDVALNYAFFKSDHEELDDFNLTQHMVELAGRWKLTNRRTLRWSTAWQHLLLGTQVFDRALLTGPSLVFSGGRGQTTSLDLRYRWTDFENASIFRTNADRTGRNWSLGIMHNVPVSPKRVVRVGYSADVDKARVTTWDGTGHKVNAEAGFMLPNDMLFDVYAEYYVKDYDGVYRSIGGHRHDRAFSAAVTLTRYFHKKVGVSLRSLWTRNHSNVRSFDMSRAIHGILIDTRF